MAPNKAGLHNFEIGCGGSGTPDDVGTRPLLSPPLHASIALGNNKRAHMDLAVNSLASRIWLWADHHTWQPSPNEDKEWQPLAQRCLFTSCDQESQHHPSVL
mmetsp:Transcript_125823/g.251068  ORF Transcript_125823/g.251068 Transcript_125823/m.251068 type:complete len:102 (-) Transcript_125823:461-766(-)